MNGDKRGCTCHRCGRVYLVDIIVPNELWLKVAGEDEMLCGVCIVTAMEEIGQYAAYGMVAL